MALAGAKHQDTLLVDSDGDIVNWDDQSSCGSDYLCMDEGWPSDSDITFLRTMVVDDTTLFNFSDFAPTNFQQVDSTVEILYTKDKAGGTKVSRWLIRSGATTQEGSDITHQDAWTRHQMKRSTLDPNTGSAWTEAALDIIQTGIVSKTGFTTGQGGRGADISSFIFVIYWEDDVTGADTYEGTVIIIQ